jgi:antitoxin (DNA-binding transcriptional repressor) of toxin-antitoxin stability system
MMPPRRHENVHHGRTRGKASELRKVISRESQASLTASGEPIALLAPADSERPGENRLDNSRVTLRRLLL